MSVKRSIPVTQMSDDFRLPDIWVTLDGMPSVHLPFIFLLVAPLTRCEARLNLSCCCLSVTEKMCRRLNRYPITFCRGRPRDPMYSAYDWLSDYRLSLLVP